MTTRLIIPFLTLLLPLLASIPGAHGQARSTETSFEAEVLMADFDAYRKTVAGKANEFIEKKRSEVLYRLRMLEKEARKAGDTELETSLRDKVTVLQNLGGWGPPPGASIASGETGESVLPTVTDVARQGLPVPQGPYLLAEGMKQQLGPYSEISLVFGVKNIGGNGPFFSMGRKGGSGLNIGIFDNEVRFVLTAQDHPQGQGQGQKEPTTTELIGLVDPAREEQFIYAYFNRGLIQLFVNGRMFGEERTRLREFTPYSNSVTISEDGTIGGWGNGNLTFHLQRLHIFTKHVQNIESFQRFPDTAFETSSQTVFSLDAAALTLSHLFEPDRIIKDGANPEVLWRWQKRKRL